MCPVLKPSPQTGFSLYLANAETGDRHQSHNEYDPDMLLFSTIRISRSRRDMETLNARRQGRCGFCAVPCTPMFK